MSISVLNKYIFVNKILAVGGVTSEGMLCDCAILGKYKYSFNFLGG